MFPVELDTADEFKSWVDRMVAEAVRLPIDNFSSLVEYLPGIYPEEVRHSLLRLAQADSGVDHVAPLMALSANASNEILTQSVWYADLLPPHPLDFEWRFSRTAIDALVEVCNASTPVGGSVALVATPTIAATADAAFGGRRVSYFGVDTEALRAFGLPDWLNGLFNVNLLKRQYRTERYATIIMDPPWYDEYVRRFVWFGAQVICPGGTLLIAMPPDGTRPGILTENNRMLSWYHDLGFELEAVDLARLPYETPLFERNALRALGIVNFHPTWRKANLWHLRKVRQPSAAWPGDLVSSTWSEYRFGSVRIRVDRGAPNQGDDPRLRSLVENDVLPAVSRRDTRRDEARVWTTGNRIFGCDAPRLLAGILDDWNGNDNSNIASEDMMLEVREQIHNIVEKETRELV